MIMFAYVFGYVVKWCQKCPVCFSVFSYTPPPSSICVTVVDNIIFSGGSKGGGGWGGLYSPFGVIFTKAKFTSKILVLNEYEIYLKMLDLAILGIRIFQNFWRSMTPLESLRLWRSLVPPDPPLIFFTHFVYITFCVLSFYIRFLGHGNKRPVVLTGLY